MRLRRAFVLFLLLEALCIGAGMGVPVFCILLGFPTGWYIARKIVSSAGAVSGAAGVLGRTLAYSALTSGITLAAMAAIWLPALRMLSDPASDIANFGHPMILYDPLPSFIGWLVLMVAVSPFLQFLATVSAAHATLWMLLRGGRTTESDPASQAS